MAALPQSVKKKDGGRIGGAQACPNVVEYRCLVTMPNGKQASFAFNGHFTTPVANMQTLAGAAWTAISSAWGTNVAPHTPPETRFQSVHVRDMTAPSNPVFIGTGAAVPGTGADPAMPSDNAIVLSENITQRGKGLKGRMYIGGWDTSADLGGGVISPAASTACNALGTAIFNFLTAQTQTPCVPQVARAEYLGITGSHHNARAASFAPVSSYTVNDTEWDTQRRRGL
jgi:hypothetical protein